MKVVIIGGGIAGLTLGVFLTQKGTQVIINERYKETPLNGHAFLMHTDAMKVLKGIDKSINVLSLGKTVKTFALRRPSGKEIMHLQLDSWKCIKRVDLINFLTEKLQTIPIKLNRSFSHFIYDRDHAIAAVFQNGEIEYGDVFIGADGANSAVLLQESQTRREFRIALPQTGQFSDLKPQEKVVFSFDPSRAVCFTARAGAAGQDA